MKRTLVTVLACVFAAGLLLSGCQSAAGTQPPAASGTQAPAASTAPAAPAATSAEVVNLQGLCVTSSLTKDVSTLAYLNEMQKKAGVAITWQQISSDWGEKKSTMLASGGLPDIFLGPAIVDSDFAQFPGLFAKMNDLIDKDAPNVQKMFLEHPELKTISTQLDGSIYGLPKFQRYWPHTMLRQMINKNWLEALNLSMPTNLDELYNVLVAFKTGDPNKNGKADEVPMDWAPGVGGFSAPGMAAAFGLPVCQYQGQGYFVQDGKVKNLFITEEYKELVKFLNKCYAAGLINPEVFTQDYTAFQNLSRSPDAARVGFTMGWDILDRMGPQWASQYEVVPPLAPAGASDKAVWEVSYYNANYASAYAVMSENCQNKDAAMKFLDLFYDPYFGMQALFGSVGDCIQDNGDGTYKVLAPKDSNMDPGTWKWTNAMADNSPMYISDSVNLELPEDMKLLAEYDKAYESYIAKIPQSDYWPGVFMKYSTEDNTSLATVSTDIGGILTQKFADWVSKGGIDAEWDGYVTKLKQGGLDTAIQIYQKYYDSYIGSNK